ncbi:MAG: putative PurR-regulated permease PerM [Psychromonas sp.]|jgi:predicted PurR-regulated permease PerM
MATQKKSTSITLASNLFIAVIIVFILWILKNVMVPLIFAAILAILILPVCSFLEKYRVPRALAITLTIFISFALVVLIITLMVGQIRTLDSVWPLMIDKGEEWLKLGQDLLSEKFNIQQDEQLTQGREYITELFKSSTSLISGTLSNTTGFLADLALIPLYVFLMLLYRDFFQEFLYRFFDKQTKKNVNGVTQKIKGVAQNYMSGLLLVILLVGILNTVSLLLLGIQNAFFFGFFAAVLVLVPYVGVAIGSILPIILALITKDSAWYALGVAASFGLIQFLEGNFITPFIVGSKVSINSFTAIVALILFGNLWGIGGLVLALPLTAIIKVIFDSTENLKPWGFLLGDADAMK